MPAMVLLVAAHALRMRLVGAAVLVMVVGGGCSLRQVAASKLGDTLSSGAAGWSTEDDPELLREALPFALKTMEGLAAEAPRHRGLKLGLCRGFASYAAAFLEADADELESSDFEGARALRDRARRLHLRGRSACFGAIDLALPGTSTRLLAGDDAALASFRQSDVELLYWTGVAWGSAISLGLDRPENVAELPTVRALFERALALDEAWDRGSLHEAMIVFDSMPPMMGGSFDRARVHYDAAVRLADGDRASPYVTWARASAVSRQARDEFREALERALAVDLDAWPGDRALNRVAQRRARILLSRIDDYFFAEEETP
jgi:predicted anti-sigma-YlaC factor YlaD